MYTSDVSLRRSFLLKSFKLFDLALLAFSFLLASYVSHQCQVYKVSFEDFLAIRVTVKNIILCFSLIGSWHVVLCFTGLYDSRRLSPRWNEIYDVLKAVAGCTLLVFVEAHLVEIQIVTLNFIAFFFLSSGVLLVAGRLLLRVILHQLRIKGRNLRHLLIVGTDETALRFADKAVEKQYLGYDLFGFVDNRWQVQGSPWAFKGLPLIPFDGFASFLRKNVVDEVIICLPAASDYVNYSNIISICEEQGVLVRFLSDMFGSRLTRVRKEQFGDTAVITLYSGPMMGTPMAFKRLFDVLFSFIFLIIFFPLILLIAVAIKLDSPGPVFFRQARIGRNKRQFKLIKFRTMVPDAEIKLKELEKFNEVSGPVFKIKDDPRITRIGKLLRKSSLDELPQLINVLKGDMSLVGPRPLPVRDY
ncbi:MAG: exopolysaccharide biosynthesis polyprenyl glycosylphosphotransferase, partial [Desulfobulbaceae bacterium]|nr:exopolysaccharide biosynthesis polyprenyl glycosylphosphotransferase [Desulfobulbaceae bacterium]